jgi:hypothetical protein
LFGGNGALIHAFAAINPSEGLAIIQRDSSLRLLGSREVAPRIDAFVALLHEFAHNDPMTYLVYCVMASCHETMDVDDVIGISGALFQSQWPHSEFGRSIEVPLHVYGRRECLREALRRSFYGPLSSLVRSSALQTSVQRVIGLSDKHKQHKALHFIAKEAFLM